MSFRLCGRGLDFDFPRSLNLSVDNDACDSDGVMANPERGYFAPCLGKNKMDTVYICRNIRKECWVYFPDTEAA